MLAVSWVWSWWSGARHYEVTVGAHFGGGQRPRVAAQLDHRQRSHRGGVRQRGQRAVIGRKRGAGQGLGARGRRLPKMSFELAGGRRRIGFVGMALGFQVFGTVVVVDVWYHLKTKTCTARTAPDT